MDERLRRLERDALCDPSQRSALRRMRRKAGDKRGDPRWCPKPGDVVRNEVGEIRRVNEPLLNQPWHVVRYTKISGRLRVRGCGLKNWRKWAKDAEVLATDLRRSSDLKV